MGKKLVGIGLTAFMAVAALAMPTQARADDDGTFKSPLVGSIPSQPVAGVPSGGALWVIRRGEVTIQDGGRLTAEVRGLLLGGGASIGTTAGIPALAASVVCGGVVAASTDPAPFSAAGDFQVRQALTLPQPCRGAVLLIRIARTGVPLGSYIAVSGLPD